MSNDKTNLYDLHEDLAGYFKDTLRRHAIMLDKLEKEFTHEDNNMTVSEYQNTLQQISLPPAVLTAIATFLKTNDVRVLPDDTGAALDEYEDKVKRFKKASVADCKHDLDIN